MIGWLVGWWVGGLVGWLVALLIAWVAVALMMGCLLACLAGWLEGLVSRRVSLLHLYDSECAKGRIARNMNQPTQHIYLGQINKSGLLHIFSTVVAKQASRCNHFTCAMQIAQQ